MDPVILKSRAVQHQDNRATRHASAVAKGATPEVRLVAVDGVVRALEVRCACGSTTTVELDVEPTSRPSAGGAS